MRLRLSGLSLVIMLCLFTGSALAQEHQEENQDAAEAPSASLGDTEAPIGGIGDTQAPIGWISMEEVEERQLVAPSDQYIPPFYSNLSKLYWAIGKMDLEKPSDVDGFLQINECFVYQRYVNSDLEWNKIRKVTKDMIIKDMASYPRHFEIIIPIYLERYDEAKGEFPLEEESQLVDSRRLDYQMASRLDVCDQRGEVDGYPPNLLLVFNRPLTITSVPASRELAKYFIRETGERFKNLPRALQIEKYQRVAYLRLKVRIVQYKETVRIANRFQRATVFSVVDGYEIYADEKKINLLHKHDFPQERRRKKKSENEQDADADALDAVLDGIENNSHKVMTEEAPAEKLKEE